SLDMAPQRSRDINSLEGWHHSLAGCAVGVIWGVGWCGMIDRVHSRIICIDRASGVEDIVGSSTLSFLCARVSVGCRASTGGTS
ncbi:hypothetical protein HAX54_001280, partial [Datura stramonium]|nr:hypothetical protein [Datura stramonium]